MVVRHAGPNGGDILFVLTVEDTAPNFRRVGNDLHTSITIPLKDALLGFSRTIDHVDGTALRVSNTATTQPGHVLRVKRCGMKAGWFSFGDCVVTVNVSFDGVSHDDLVAIARIIDM